MYCFDMPVTPWQTGSRIENVHNQSPYQDLSRFGLGSYDNTSPGPGAGIAMMGGGNAFTQYTRRMDSAYLAASDLPSFFGSGAEHEDGQAMAGSSLYVHTEEAEMNIYYLKGPGFGTWRWEHVHASSSGDSGTYTPSDPVDIEVDSESTTILSHTVTASDTYASRVFTFDVGDVAFADVEVGHAVTLIKSGGNDFGGIGVIESRTSNSFTLKFDFSDSTPATGDVLHFGPFEIAKETYTMPTTTDEYRGVRITSLTEITFILGFGAVRTNTPGVALGTHGWSGNGYGNQLDEWARESLYGEFCALAGINLAIMNVAEQGSVETDMTERFPDALVAESPGTEIYLAGDPQNGPGDTASRTTTTEILSQTVYAGGSAYASLHTGDAFTRAVLGHMGNDPHPNMIGHAATARVHLHIAANLTQAAIGGVVSASGGSVIVGESVDVYLNQRPKAF